MAMCLLDVAVINKIISKASNGFYSMGEKKLGRGLSNTLITLCKDPDGLLIPIDQTIREKLSIMPDNYDFVIQRYRDNAARTLELLGEGNEEEKETNE